MKAIIQNAAYLFGARLVNAVSSLITYLMISHQLGKELFGLFALWNTIILTGIIVANFGTDVLIVKMIKREPSMSDVILSSTLYLKIIVSSFIIFLIIAVSFILHVDPFSRKMLILYSGAILLNALSQSFWYYGNALNQMNYHAVLWAASNVLKVVFIFFGLILQRNLVAVIYAVMAAEIITLIMSYGWIKVKFKIKKIKTSMIQLVEMFVQALPLAIIFFVSVIYSRFDMFMVGLLCNSQSIGEYAAASKFLEFISLIPITFMIAIFPILQSEYLKNNKTFYKTAKKIGSYIAIAGLAAFILMFVSSRVLIIKLYGEEFMESILLLKILSLSIMFLFINSYMAYYNFAINNEKMVTFIIAFMVFFNIIVNYVLIRIYNLQGAAVTRVISEFIVSILYLIIIYRHREKVHC